MSIPASVRRDQVREALKPFYDLLGIADVNIYEEPALTIAADKIIFVVPASAGSVDSSRDRVKGVRQPDEFPHPQDGENEHAELAYVVTVPVTGSRDRMTDLLARQRETNDALTAIRERLDEMVHGFAPLSAGKIGDAINRAAASTRRDRGDR